MNLFIVGWNCSSADRERAVRTLRAMHASFPLLDPETFGRWGGEHGFAAWMHVGAGAGPRRYVHRTDEGLTLVDGMAVDPRGRIVGHDAGSLAQHWAEAPDHLEGNYAAVRLEARAGMLEIVNDPFGLHPVFVQRSGDTWWIANSVRLLVGVSGAARLDLQGVADFVGTFFPGHDRTLVEGVSVLPAAQRWRWRAGADVERSTYLPLSAINATKRSFGAERASELAKNMGDLLEVLSTSFGPLECPITAGRDSRMLTGLMVARGLPGDFFSAGDPQSTDVTIGRLVADRLGLPHRGTGGSGAEIAEAWDEVSARMVRQLDGMVTFAHARNALKSPTRLERKAIHLYGAAGELGRGKRLTPALVLQDASLEHAIELTRKTSDRGSALVRPEVWSETSDRLAEACRELHSLGFEARDVPDAFDLWQYGRRWGGAQARQGANYRDVVMPFVTRDYMSTAFATPWEERLVERVPFELLKHLSPKLHALPFDTPWPPQSIPLLLATQWPRRVRDGLKRRLKRLRGPEAGRARDRLVTFELLRERWRRYLDRSSSSSWQVIDRERFEHLTSDRATQQEQQSALGAMYQAVTVLAYEEDLGRWIDERAADADLARDEATWLGSAEGDDDTRTTAAR